MRAREPVETGEIAKQPSSLNSLSSVCSFGVASSASRLYCDERDDSHEWGRTYLRVLTSRSPSLNDREASCHLIQHQVNHHSRHRHIQPDRQRPPRDLPVPIETRASARDSVISASGRIVAASMTCVMQDGEVDRRASRPAR